MFYTCGVMCMLLSLRVCEHAYIKLFINVFLDGGYPGLTVRSNLPDKITSTKVIGNTSEGVGYFTGNAVISR